MSQRRRKAPALGLYWCWFEHNHERDWFVLGRSARDARRAFQSADEDDARDEGRPAVELIARLPAKLQTTRPSQDIERAIESQDIERAIEACGGRFLRRHEPRVVVIGGITYREGGLGAWADGLMGIAAGPGPHGLARGITSGRRIGAPLRALAGGAPKPKKKR